MTPRDDTGRFRPPTHRERQQITGERHAGVIVDLLNRRDANHANLAAALGIGLPADTVAARREMTSSPYELPRNITTH